MLSQRLVRPTQVNKMKKGFVNSLSFSSSSVCAICSLPDPRDLRDARGLLTSRLLGAR